MRDQYDGGVITGGIDGRENRENPHVRLGNDHLMRDSRDALLRACGRDGRKRQNSPNAIWKRVFKGLIAFRVGATPT